MIIERPRHVAAIWFGIAGAVTAAAAVLFPVIDPRDTHEVVGGYELYLIVAPAILASWFGATIGGRIFTTPHSGWASAWRGALVAMVTLLVHSQLFVPVFVITGGPYTSSIRLGTDYLFAHLISLLIAFFVGGGHALVGGLLTGWLLRRHAMRTEARCAVGSDEAIG